MTFPSPCRFPLRCAQLAALLALPLSAQCEPSFQPGDLVGSPRGPGAAMLVWDPDGNGPAPDMLVAGGRFVVAADRDVPVAAYDGADWRSLRAPSTGSCTALGVFGGRLIAAIARNSDDSHVLAFDGTTWQTLGAMNGEANAMTLFNGNLVIGGRFNLINGLPASNVSQWTGSTSTWSALGGGVDGTVRALAAFSGVLYVGGDIAHASGIPVSNLAIWNGAGWAASAACNRTVQALAVRSTTSAATSHLFVGGLFTAVGGLAARSVARFNSITGWSAMAGFPGSCSSFYVRSTGLTTYELNAGTSSGTASLYRWSGSVWNPVGTPAFGSPLGLAMFRGRYVALRDDLLWTVRALDGAGSWLPVSGTGIDGPVTAVHATTTDVVIGGHFVSISGVQMNGIARGAPGAWQPLGTGVLGGSVKAIARLPNGDIIAGGDFTSAGGVSANRIARWDGNGWSPLGSGVSATVFALAVLPDGHVVAAGNFLQAGGQSANRIALWNGATWTALASGFDDVASTLVVAQNGELIAGGAFSTAGGIAARFLARWNGSTWLPFPGQPSSVVSSLAVLSNGEILVGGVFRAIGNLETNHLARWDGTLWFAVPGFAHDPPNHVIQIVPLPNREAIVVSRYSTLRTLPLSRFNGHAVVALPDPLATFVAGARSPDGEVLLVGDFASVGNVTSAFVARYVSPCPATAPPYGSGCRGSGGVNALRATQLPWIGSAFRGAATGMPATGLALGVTGLTQISIPIASLLRQGLPGCDLLATLDLLEVVTPQLGQAHTVLVLPALSSLIGQVLHHQVVAFELDTGSNLVAVTGSNGLRLTLGVF